MSDVFYSFFSPLLDSGATLAVFPALLGFRLLAPTLIRLVLSPLLVVMGFRLCKVRTKISLFVGTINIVFGISILFGFLTQISALVLIITSLWRMFYEYKYLPKTQNFWGLNLLVAVTLMSLLITGAGLFAIDLSL
ncbi:MAG: TQO small subunit DoxD [Candidatus Paceibacterota bacterium]